LTTSSSEISWEKSEKLERREREEREEREWRERGGREKVSIV
jgi:hypothetical protein